MSNGFERKSTSGEMMMLNGTVVNHGPVAGGLGKQSFLSDLGWWPRSGHGRTPTRPKRYGRERLWRETARYLWVQERLPRLHGGQRGASIAQRVAGWTRVQEDHPHSPVLLMSLEKRGWQQGREKPCGSAQGGALGVSREYL